VPLYAASAHCKMAMSHNDEPAGAFVGLLL
jgi:hypothetical protein